MLRDRCNVSDYSACAIVCEKSIISSKRHAHSFVSTFFINLYMADSCFNTVMYVYVSSPSQLALFGYPD